MPAAKKTRKVVRRSISLPLEVDSKVQRLAKRQNWSANQMLESLIEAGLESKEAEKRRFFTLAEKLRTTTDGKEIQDIKNELARMTFGV
jgi:predicted DNA-binding protein